MNTELPIGSFDMRKISFFPLEFSINDSKCRVKCTKKAIVHKFDDSTIGSFNVS
jgi:hypothetical protein